MEFLEAEELSISLSSIQGLVAKQTNLVLSLKLFANQGFVALDGFMPGSGCIGQQLRFYDELWENL